MKINRFLFTEVRGVIKSWQIKTGKLKNILSFPKMYFIVCVCMCVYASEFGCP